MFAAYAATAFISLRPARIYKFNLTLFCRAGASLLSSATEEDRINFAEDLLQSRNLERLVKYASAWERADDHATHIESERLPLAGQPQSFSGRAPISAFYLFAHRKELELAGWAYSFLRIVCDHEFCATLVKKSAWLTASALDRLKEQKDSSPAVQEFVQAIAGQAILNEESMMAKEHGYSGFANAPILSRSLFKDRNFLRRYDPLRGLQFKVPDSPTEGFVRRLNDASEMILNTAIDGKDYWPTGYVQSVTIAYKALSNRWRIDRNKGKSIEYGYELHAGVDQLSKIVLEGLSSLDARITKQLFVTEPEKHRSDIVNSVASIAYESLECVANEFLGFEDEAWFYAQSLLSNIYPAYDEQVEGLNPLQQQLALKLIKKLSQNMNGWYPSMSRVLLAVIGPYSKRSTDKKRTAFIILKDAVYFEFKKLAVLNKNAPQKISQFLPSNVKYNPKTNTLTHSYRGGEKEVTKLSQLRLVAVDLCDEKNWYVDTVEDNQTTAVPSTR